MENLSCECRPMVLSMQSLQAVSSAALNQWLLPNKLSGGFLKQQHIYQDIIHFTHLSIKPSAFVKMCTLLLESI